MNVFKYKRFRLILMSSFLFLSLTGFHWWDPVARWMGIGNKALEAGDLDKAETAYSTAGGIAPEDERIQYNEGIVEYSRENFDAAGKLFDIAAKSRDPDVQSRALYNLGCTQIQQGDLAGAAESFTEALKINPDDMDAKTNLEMVTTILEQMPTPTPPPSEGGSENQDQKDPDDQDESAPTPDPDRTPETDDSADSSEETPEATATPDNHQSAEMASENTPTPAATFVPDGSQDSEPEPADEEGVMSRREAERLLDAQEEEEMEVRKRFHQLPPVSDRTIEKDW